MTIYSLFTRQDQTMFAALIATSIVFAIILEVWWHKYPQSYEAFTWVQVVIGDGYILIGLGFILPLDVWVKVCTAIFVASIPIIARSLIIHAINWRDAERVEIRRREK